ncbi:MAG: hypothetical protein HDQ91_05590 [Desulfovibrio sp.]|nr:hypothetical protein [Desulfovibrio sp.]
MPINDRTTNFDLPLPHPDNHMNEDCGRIRDALIGVDAEMKKLEEKAATAATKTALDAVKVTADAALPKTTAASTYATKTETAAIKATADAAATKTALDAVKATADGALQKSGGEMTGDINFRPVPGTKPNFNVAVYDDNDLRVAAFRGGIRDDDSRYSSLIGFDHAGVYRTSVTVNIEKNGEYYTTYATCPPPRSDNYGNDIVTAKALKDFAIQQLTTDRIASIANNTAKLPDGGTWACMGANAANVKICAGGTAPGFVCNAFRVA